MPIVLRPKKKKPSVCPAPLWYRGLSNEQVDAAKALQDALTDDIHQGTTYRVHQCLFTIGISPMATSEELSVIMNCSRGNDLAFLYFLMCAYYKSEPRDNNITGFNINEQYILSCIAKLDTPFTLEALDRILPSPPNTVAAPSPIPQVSTKSEKKRYQLSTPYQASNKAAGVNKAPLPVSTPYQAPNKVAGVKRLPLYVSTPYPALNRCGDVSTLYPTSRLGAGASPYFQKQPRPSMPPDTKKYLSSPPATSATFEDEPQPYQGRSREENRWFATYEFQPKKRITKAIVTEELNRLFDNIDCIQLDGSESLCTYHRNIRDLERDTYLVEARKRCLQLLQGQRKERTRQRIASQLERDVERYMKEFGPRWSDLKPTVPASDCKVCSHLTTEPTSIKEPVVLLVNGGERICSPLVSLCEEKAAQRLHFFGLRCGDAFNACEEDNQRLPGGQDKPETQQQQLPRPVGHTQTIPRMQPKCSCESADGPRRTPLGECSHNQRNVNRGCLRRRSSRRASRPSKRAPVELPFFQPPSKHKPYAFDYDRVFDIGAGPRNSEENIKTNFVRALHKPIDQETELNSKSFANLAPYQRVDVIAAVSKCANKIIEKFVESAPPYIPETPSIVSTNEPPKLSFEDRTSFDPNDDVLMDQMLKDAFGILRQDARYVLASLPDGHLLPVLREWVRKRYGKRYPSVEDDEIRKKLLALAENLSAPRPKALFQNRNFPHKYGELGRIRNEAKEYTKIYETKVANEIMEGGRRCWQTMKLDRCHGHDMRNTFFSYMPNRRRDIVLPHNACR
ncbi:uncharacterized protein LOC115625932 [Scaptodrosophila lebanonensis]|uniref:Uncharacterized protein LOC115625932 n=1 Tax=Drosophila lebanonensis TaxID=7225 RepID=A0A6J2TLV1_DROLE|nr:uncharacterized protein LOC115625932 [Scaptodrosophila lebanonensis]